MTCKCNCEQSQAAEAAIVQLRRERDEARRERDEMRRVVDLIAEFARCHCGNCPAIATCRSDEMTCAEELIKWAKGEL